MCEKRTSLVRDVRAHSVGAFTFIVIQNFGEEIEDELNPLGSVIEASEAFAQNGQRVRSPLTGILLRRSGQSP